MNQATSQSVLSSKPHFQILDGLRGLAAVAVVIFHFMEIAVPDYKENFIAHAYLAVDFFFCLSGFVIAYAYDQRLKNIGIANFFKLRLIRLHPLVIIGSIIGILAFAFDPMSKLFEVYQSKSLLMFLASCLMIPYALVHERYFNFFHLNPPTWSLFWEYVANIVYAFILVKLKNKVLWFLIVVAAILLGYEAFKSGNLSVGWGGDNFFGGGARIFFSFVAGILVYRSNWKISSKLGFAVIGASLLAVFIIPYSDKTNFIVDPLVVILFFPFLIALGAGTNPEKKSGWFCRFSGEISYPLYMVHYPFIWLFMSYVESKKPTINEMIIVMVVGVILLMILAYLVLILIDIPIRKKLKKKMDTSLISTSR